MARPLFIGGTASHVGKSWFTAAFCRMLVQRGERVAPFKAQNMSNNSYPCLEGGEIGRSQAMQAEACGLPPMADMNPVLLKPNSATGSQVVVQGRVWGNVEAAAYYQHTDRFLGLALESFARLYRQFDRVVCEGAGSVAEMNLLARDITNLRLAHAVGASALLVADIERGGVFASLVGTLELLPPELRGVVKAFAVNRFCGDLRLFDDGVRFLEDRLGIPCLGVFPMDRLIVVADEDSVGLEESLAGDAATVAVVRFPRISNFTDFRRLGAVDWVTRPSAKVYDTVILPGTKNTLEDLQWLRAQGLEEWLRAQHRHGARMVGICGGYQMLGRTVADPEGLESSCGTVEGLGLLPVDTVLQGPKVTRVVTARTRHGHEFQAYEIHMGRTQGAVDAPFSLGSEPEGCSAPGVWGTYLHGALEDSGVLREMLGVEAHGPGEASAQYDRLATWLLQHARPAVLEALLA